MAHGRRKLGRNAGAVRRADEALLAQPVVRNAWTLTGGLDAASENQASLDGRGASIHDPGRAHADRGVAVLGAIAEYAVITVAVRRTTYRPRSGTSRRQQERHHQPDPNACHRGL